MKIKNCYGQDFNSKIKLTLEMIAISSFKVGILVAHSGVITLKLTKNFIVAQKASFAVSMIEFPGAVIRIESQRTL